MGFLDEVRAQASNVTSKCAFGKFLAGLDPKERGDIEAVCELPIDEVGHSAIYRALQARGYEVSKSSLSRHRGQGCSCRSRMK